MATTTNNNTKKLGDILMGGSVTLTYPSLTLIPNNNPPAVPSLWNLTYLEIQQNFDDLVAQIDTIQVAGDGTYIDNDSSDQLTLIDNSIGMDKLKTSPNSVLGETWDTPAGIEDKFVNGENLKLHNGDSSGDPVETIYEAIQELRLMDTSSLSLRIDQVSRQLANLLAEIDLMRDNPYEANGPFWVVVLDYIGKHGIINGISNFISDHNLEKTTIGWRLKNFVDSQDKAGIETQRQRFIGESFHELSGFAQDFKYSTVLSGKISYYNGHIYLLKDYEYLLKIDVISGEVINTYTFHKSIKEESPNMDKPFIGLSIDPETGRIYILTNGIMSTDATKHQKIISFGSERLPRVKFAEITPVNVNPSVTQGIINEPDQTEFINNPGTTNGNEVEYWKTMGMSIGVGFSATGTENYMYLLQQPFQRYDKSLGDEFVCNFQHIRKVELLSIATDNGNPNSSGGPSLPYHKINWFCDISSTSNLTINEKLNNLVDQIQCIKKSDGEDVEFLMYKPTMLDTLHKGWSIFRVHCEFDSTGGTSSSGVTVSQELNDGYGKDYIGKYFIEDHDYEYVNGSFISFYKNTLYYGSNKNIHQYKIVLTGYRKSLSRNVTNSFVTFGYSNKTFSLSYPILYKNLEGEWKSRIKETVLEKYFQESLIGSITTDAGLPEISLVGTDLYQFKLKLESFDQTNSSLNLNFIKDSLKYLYVQLWIDGKFELLEIKSNENDQEAGIDTGYIKLTVHSKIDLTSADVNTIAIFGFPKWTESVDTIHKEGRSLYSNYKMIENQVSKNIDWKPSALKNSFIPVFDFTKGDEIVNIFYVNKEIRADSLLLNATKYGKLYDYENPSNYEMVGDEKVYSIYQTDVMGREKIHRILEGFTGGGYSLYEYLNLLGGTIESNLDSIVEGESTGIEGSKHYFQFNTPGDYLVDFDFTLPSGYIDDGYPASGDPGFNMVTLVLTNSTSSESDYDIDSVMFSGSYTPSLYNLTKTYETNPGWSTDEHKGKYLKIGVGPDIVYAEIISNTSNSFECDFMVNSTVSYINLIDSNLYIIGSGDPEWTTDEFAGKYVKVESEGFTYYWEITGNDSDTLTINFQIPSNLSGTVFLIDFAEIYEEDLSILNRESIPVQLEIWDIETNTLVAQHTDNHPTLDAWIKNLNHHRENEAIIPFRGANLERYTYFEPNKLYKVILRNVSETGMTCDLPGLKENWYAQPSSIINAKKLYFDLTDQFNNLKRENLKDSFISQVIEDDDQILTTYSTLVENNPSSYTMSILGKNYSNHVSSQILFDCPGFETKDVWALELQSDLIGIDSGTDTVKFGFIDDSNKSKTFEITPTIAEKTSGTVSIHVPFKIYDPDKIIADFPQAISSGSDGEEDEAREYMQKNYGWEISDFDNWILPTKWYYTLDGSEISDSSTSFGDLSFEWSFKRQPLKYYSNHPKPREQVKKEHHVLSKIVNIIDDQIYFISMNFSAPMIPIHQQKGYSNEWTSGYKYYNFEREYKGLLDDRDSLTKQGIEGEECGIPFKYLSDEGVTWNFFKDVFNKYISETIDDSGGDSVSLPDTWTNTFSWKNIFGKKSYHGNDSMGVSPLEVVEYEQNFEFYELSFFPVQSFEHHGSIIQVINRNSLEISDKWADKSYKNVINNWHEYDPRPASTKFKKSELGINWEFPFFNNIEKLNGKMNYHHSYLNIPHKKYYDYDKKELYKDVSDEYDTLMFTFEDPHWSSTINGTTEEMSLTVYENIPGIENITVFIENEYGTPIFENNELRNKFIKIHSPEEIYCRIVSNSTNSFNFELDKNLFENGDIVSGYLQKFYDYKNLNFGDYYYPDYEEGLKRFEHYLRIFDCIDIRKVEVRDSGYDKSKICFAITSYFDNYIVKENEENEYKPSIHSEVWDISSFIKLVDKKINLVNSEEAFLNNLPAIKNNVDKYLFFPTQTKISEDGSVFFMIINGNPGISGFIGQGDFSLSLQEGIWEEREQTKVPQSMFKSLPLLPHLFQITFNTNELYDLTNKMPKDLKDKFWGSYRNTFSTYFKPQEGYVEKELLIEDFKIQYNAQNEYSQQNFNGWFFRGSFWKNGIFAEVFQPTFFKDFSYQFQIMDSRIVRDEQGNIEDIKIIFWSNFNSNIERKENGIFEYSIINQNFQEIQTNFNYNLQERRGGEYFEFTEKYHTKFKQKFIDNVLTYVVRYPILDNNDYFSIFTKNVEDYVKNIYFLLKLTKWSREPAFFINTFGSSSTPDELIGLSNSDFVDMDVEFTNLKTGEFDIKIPGDEKRFIHVGAISGINLWKLQIHDFGLYENIINNNKGKFNLVKISNGVNNVYFPVIEVGYNYIIFASYIASSGVSSPHVESFHFESEFKLCNIGESEYDFWNDVHSETNITITGKELWQNIQTFSDPSEAFQHNNGYEALKWLEYVGDFGVPRINFFPFGESTNNNDPMILLSPKWFVDYVLLPKLYSMNSVQDMNEFLELYEQFLCAEAINKIVKDDKNAVFSKGYVDVFDVSKKNETVFVNRLFSSSLPKILGNFGGLPGDTGFIEGGSGGGYDLGGWTLPEIPVNPITPEDVDGLGGGTLPEVDDSGGGQEISPIGGGGSLPDVPEDDGGGIGTIGGGDIPVVGDDGGESGQGEDEKETFLTNPEVSVINSIQFNVEKQIIDMKKPKQFILDYFELIKNEEEPFEEYSLMRHITFSDWEYRNSRNLDALTNFINDFDFNRSKFVVGGIFRKIEEDYNNPQFDVIKQWKIDDRHISFNTKSMYKTKNIIDEDGFGKVSIITPKIMMPHELTYITENVSAGSMGFWTSKGRLGNLLTKYDRLMIENSNSTSIDYGQREFVIVYSTEEDPVNRPNEVKVNLMKALLQESGTGPGEGIDESSTKITFEFDTPDLMELVSEKGYINIPCWYLENYDPGTGPTVRPMTDPTTGERLQLYVDSDGNELWDGSDPFYTQPANSYKAFERIYFNGIVKINEFQGEFIECNRGAISGIAGDLYLMTQGSDGYSHFNNDPIYFGTSIDHIRGDRVRWVVSKQRLEKLMKIWLYLADQNILRTQDYKLAYEGGTPSDKEDMEDNGLEVFPKYMQWEELTLSGFADLTDEPVRFNIELELFPTDYLDDSIVVNRINTYWTNSSNQ